MIDKLIEICAYIKLSIIYHLLYTYTHTDINWVVSLTGSISTEVFRPEKHKVVKTRSQSVASASPGATSECGMRLSTPDPWPGGTGCGTRV